MGVESLFLDILKAPVERNVENSEEANYDC